MYLLQGSAGGGQADKHKPHIQLLQFQASGPWMESLGELYIKYTYEELTCECMSVLSAVSSLC